MEAERIIAWAHVAWIVTYLAIPVVILTLDRPEKSHDR